MFKLDLILEIMNLKDHFLKEKVEKVTGLIKDKFS